MIDRVVNFTERLICLPPLTIWPAEAKAKRASGETASVMLLADGTEALPVRVYSAIACPPGVTVSQDGPCPEDTAKEDVPQILLTDSHDQAYWDIVTVKAKKALDAKYVEFRGADAPRDRSERELLEMQARASAKIEIKDRSAEEALKFIGLEDNTDTLKRWNGKEIRPRVKKAIAARILEL